MAISQRIHEQENHLSFPEGTKTLQFEHLPQDALFLTSASRPVAEPSIQAEGAGTAIGWQLSPTPLYLTPAEGEDLHRFGQVLWSWIQALETLYRESLTDKAPAWVAQYLHQGKPQGLLQFAHMKRFRKDTPWVLRPDLLLGEKGWVFCELDAVPGGIGFTSALNHAYAQSGFQPIGPTQPNQSMADAFYAMLLTAAKNHFPEEPNPVMVIVVSDEAADYRPEMTWLVHHLRERQQREPHRYPGELHCIHPKAIGWVRDHLVFEDENGVERPIHLIYRFFELFDLPNIPNIELIQYALKKGRVACTPPFKPVFEEKLWLALLHHPVLAPWWIRLMGEADFQWLKQWTPPSWIMDPNPLPPQGVIPGLTMAGYPLQSFDLLKNASQKERQRVIKPSGFSPEAWGSRGVTVGHDVSGEQWAEALSQALQAFENTPHLLQDYIKPKIVPWSKFQPGSSTPVPLDTRVRLCPYYFVDPQKGPELVGVLATGCPKDKKIIHGMTDAILAPVAILS